MLPVLFDIFGFSVNSYGVINKDVLLGITQPKLWSLVLVALGGYLLISHRSQSGDGAAPVPDMEVLPQDLPVDSIESVPSPLATR